MSHPIKRYRNDHLDTDDGYMPFFHDGEGVTAPEGEYVLHSDYAELAAENERLRQHLEFFRGKFDAKSNKLLARILKDTKKFAAKKGGDR